MSGDEAARRIRNFIGSYPLPRAGCSRRGSSKIRRFKTLGEFLIDRGWPLCRNRDQSDRRRIHHCPARLSCPHPVKTSLPVLPETTAAVVPKAIGVLATAPSVAETARAYEFLRTPRRMLSRGARCHQVAPEAECRRQDVEAILDAHHLGLDLQLAEAAVLTLEKRTKL